MLEVRTRAAALSVVLPAAVAIVWSAIAPLLGWPIAAWHTAFVLLVLIATIDVMMLTIRHLPFTAIYRPGHARLRTRWPLYAIGMFAVAVWPVRAELRALGGGELRIVAVLGTLALLIHLAGRRWRLPGPPTEPDEDVAIDDDGATVLNIGQVSAARHEPVAQPY